ncbi:hypothetical protein NIES4072_06180 [Nostoc commune NIES-4072]|uniref:Uncharacterized protein n=1 Tax=Nostoc commune NIES-4072 TaxID=2005467 RepID=A0A2R5FMF7_NOSCO|nr:hypothetical protein NIES4070_20650 [Nostoc commune HK-02]GBG16971.1 hypothetical protein NIES4072_06180 [Nostoc commune NIES-4072]
MLIDFNLVVIPIGYHELAQLIPFWILNFRFWIGNRSVYLGFLCPSVAIIFKIAIGIRFDLEKIYVGCVSTESTASNP